MNHMKNFLIILIVLIYLGSQVGCAHQTTMLPARASPLSEPMRQQLKTVGVVAAGFQPTVHIQTYSKESESGVGKGAEEGALAGSAVGTTGAMALLPFGFVFPPILLVAGGLFVVSTVGAAAVGGLQEQSPDLPMRSRKDAERIVTALVRNQTAQGHVRNQVLEASRNLEIPQIMGLETFRPSDPDDVIDIRRAAEEGISTILTVQLEQVVFTAEDQYDPVIAVDMSVRSTLRETSDGTLYDNRVFTCRAGKQTLAEWKSKGGTPFDKELKYCYAKIADRMIEEVFLVSSPTLSSDWGPKKNHGTSVTTTSLQPELHWKPFSLSESLAEDSGWAEGQHIRYDMKVWHADTNDLPLELVYARQGLSKPHHHIETPLQAATTYFWTVRARFDLNGQTRVTPWTVTQIRNEYAPSTLDRVTNPFYFKFTTPSHPALVQQQVTPS